MWIPILKSEAKEFAKEVARRVDSGAGGESSSGGAPTDPIPIEEPGNPAPEPAKPTPAQETVDPRDISIANVEEPTVERTYQSICQKPIEDQLKNRYSRLLDSDPASE